MMLPWCRSPTSGAAFTSMVPLAAVPSLVLGEQSLESIAPGLTPLGTPRPNRQEVQDGLLKFDAFKTHSWTIPCQVKGPSAA
jgi:hypothetical protein